MVTETQQELRDGDIFRWRWRDDDRHADNLPYRSYHCKSQWAIARSGAIYDTYWGHTSHDGLLRFSDVILTYVGNENDMDKIRPGAEVYYKPDDIVDMRHSNSSGAPIYRKAGAVRDYVAMRHEAASRLEDAQRELDRAKRKIERMEEALALIDGGDLDSVYL